MKRTILILASVILSVTVFLSGCSFRFIPFFSSEDPVYVKTMDHNGTEFHYYELNRNGDFIKCDEFEPNVNDYYLIEGFMLDDKNTFEEVYQSCEDRIYDPQINKVQPPEILKKAMAVLFSYEREQGHWASLERAFIKDDICWLSVSYNVNWVTPYLLFEYNEKENSLKKIMDVSDEQILGLSVHRGFD